MRQKKMILEMIAGMNKKQLRKYKRQQRKYKMSPRKAEYYANLYNTYLQKTCVRWSGLYYIPDSIQPKLIHRYPWEDSLSEVVLIEKTALVARQYVPLSQVCEDSLTFYACFMKPEIIELRHWDLPIPRWGGQTCLRFAIHPDGSVSFICRRDEIYE